MTHPRYGRYDFANWPFHGYDPTKMLVVGDSLRFEDLRMFQKVRDRQKLPGNLNVLCHRVVRLK